MKHAVKQRVRSGKQEHRDRNQHQTWWHKIAQHWWKWTSLNMCVCVCVWLSVCVSAALYILYNGVWIQFFGIVACTQLKDILLHLVWNVCLTRLIQDKTSVGFLLHLLYPLRGHAVIHYQIKIYKHLCFFVLVSLRSHNDWATLTRYILQMHTEAPSVHSSLWLLFLFFKNVFCLRGVRSVAV